ncbi:MAG: hypothetical protein Kow0063_41440 [Anaerolineae bacterium]
MTLDNTPSSRPCLANTAQGQPCGAWAIKGSDYCAAHPSQDGPPPAVQTSDPPRRKFETIDDLINTMYELLSSLGEMIDQAYQMQDIDRYLKTLGVYCRCLTSLSSLLRTRQALSPPAPDPLDLIAQAVDELAEEQGWTALLPGSPLIR